jgi:hypothetical protein
MQRLSIGSGHKAGEFDERLVVLSGQEQSNQVLAQRASFLEAPEQVVERGARCVNRLGGRWGGLPRSAHRLSSSRARTPVSLPVYHT